MPGEHRERGVAGRDEHDEHRHHLRQRRTPVALLTVEGEKDDISGLGQTEAAHALCSNIPADRKAHYMQPGVGHYGVFNGSRFRSEIAPRIADFVLTSQMNGAARQAKPRAVAKRKSVAKSIAVTA